MSEQEKATAQNIVNALDAMPDNMKEYLLGVADGILAARERKERTEQE
jgi:hypothetical protein